MALTSDRNTPLRTGELVRYPVEAGTQIFAGSILCINDAGFAVPGTTTTMGRVVGRAEEAVENRNGSEGDVFVTGRRGIFRFANSEQAGDEITQAHIGLVAWVVDDETVGATNGTASRIPAGLIIDVDDAGVWVDLGNSALDVTVEASPEGLLSAEQNLSDVDDPAEARANIGADVVVLQVPIEDLAEVAHHHTIAPVDGRVERVHLLAIAQPIDGDATVILELRGVPDTVAQVTVIQDSLAKTIESVAVTEGSEVAAGDLITLSTVGGLEQACPGHAVLVLRTGPAITD